MEINNSRSAMPSANWNRWKRYKEMRLEEENKRLKSENEDLKKKIEELEKRDDESESLLKAKWGKIDGLEEVDEILLVQCKSSQSVHYSILLQMKDRGIQFSLYRRSQEANIRQWTKCLMVKSYPWDSSFAFQSL